MGEDIIELINSQYKSKIHAAVEVRLSKSPLQWAESKDKAIDRPKQNLHKEMEQFFRKYSEFGQRLRGVRVPRDQRNGRHGDPRRSCTQ
jgi:hypothetical protein